MMCCRLCDVSGQSSEQFDLAGCHVPLWPAALWLWQKGTRAIYCCRPGQEQSLLESETEAEDDAADNSSVSSEGELVDFDDDGVQSDWSLTLRMGLYLGPRILNVMSGWYHRVVQSDPSAGTSADSAFGKACRPSGTLGDHYEVRTLDPGLEGCCACRHSTALVCQMAHSWHSCSDDSQSAWYLLTVLQHFGCFAWTPEWVMTGGYRMDGHSECGRGTWVHCFEVF